MTAPRPPQRRKTETTGMKLLLSAATVSLTLGAWGAISAADRAGDLTGLVAASGPTHSQVAAPAPVPSAAGRPALRAVTAPPAASAATAGSVPRLVAPAPLTRTTAEVSAAKPATQPAARTRSSR